MRLRAPLLALTAAFALAACADDAPIQPASISPDEAEGQALELEDERYWDEDQAVRDLDDGGEGLARTHHDGSLGVGPTTRTYEITLENLTPDNGNGASQVFSPPVIATHNRGIRMFRVGRFASDELAGVAEDAMNPPLVAALEGSNRVNEIVVGGGVIPPGGSATYQIASDAGRRALSMVFMLVNTNDGFSGTDALRLPVHGEHVVELYAYDAGSEANDELEASIPGPCCGTVGAGTATHERIRMHPGITGVGDLDPAVWGWEGPVARLTIKRLAPAFEITLRNLTPDTGNGGAQIFSPPVIATHSPRIRMWRAGRRASDELAGIAEDAMNQPMVDLLEASPLVSAVQVGGGVIAPGQSASYSVEAYPRCRRLSMAFMLVNTNDGFSGVDRLRLPRFGSVTYRLRTFDAGSEANDELMASIPGPCCGSVGEGTETHERIRLHPGIQGVGDLSVEKYGWDEPAAELTIVRVR